MYRSKIWTLTQSDKLLLCTLERKILCKIYCPVQEKGELGTINCISLTRHQTLSEQKRWQGCDG